MVKQRLQKLERIVLGRLDGVCHCPDAWRVVDMLEEHPFGVSPPDPGPEVCPICGEHRPTIVWRYADHWPPE